MKTEKEEELKRSWHIKETEDFDKFKNLIYELLRECELRCFMGNINLASYIESLEKRIEALENRH